MQVIRRGPPESGLRKGVVENPKNPHLFLEGRRVYVCWSSGTTATQVEVMAADLGVGKEPQHLADGGNLKGGGQNPGPWSWS